MAQKDKKDPEEQAEPEQAPQQNEGVEPTEAELAEEAEAQRNVGQPAEDETLDVVASIAKAYPIAREKCDDNPKWDTFKTALNGLSPDICKDWEDKIDENAFEANLTDHQLD